MASNFPYNKITEALTRRAYKKGVYIKPVWPAHTSTIGYWKYKNRYGISTHHAAALVIARRAMNFKERITKEVINNLKVNFQPAEGKGMTRKVKRLFNRLEEKLAYHNKLALFEQNSFNSAWHELKQLALLSR